MNGHNNSDFHENFEAFVEQECWLKAPQFWTHTAEK